MPELVVADGRNDERGGLRCGILFAIDDDARYIGERWVGLRRSGLGIVLATEQVVAKQELAGIFSSNEYGIKPRYAEALRLYHEAMAAGDLGAASGLGLMYLKGEGVTKDLEEGIRLLQEAADAKLSWGHLTLGLLYQCGTYGVPRNLQLAKKHLLQGAECGDVFCLHFLGRLCLEEGDPRTGAKYFQQASELGLEMATVDLAAMMLKGIGTERKVAEAWPCLRKVAFQITRPPAPMLLQSLAALISKESASQRTFPRQ
jgi:TPR repeat protein